MDEINLNNNNELPNLSSASLTAVDPASLFTDGY